MPHGKLNSGPGSNLTSIALTESVICKPPVCLFGRFSVGRERYNTQPLERLQLQILGRPRIGRKASNARLGVPASRQRDSVKSRWRRLRWTRSQTGKAVLQKRSAKEYSSRDLRNEQAWSFTFGGQ